VTRATTLVLGIAMGALGVLLYRRLREVVEEEDPEVLADRLARQLQILEDRTKRLPA
jgi:hypothetical protein